VVFDRAIRPIGAFGWLSQIAKPPCYLWSSLGKREVVLYLALSGGMGQLIDGLYVLVAKLLRHRIFVHHHSFAYIDRPRLLNRLLFRCLRGATHIVLSAGMGEGLIRVFGLDRAAMRVVSNAALFPSVITGDSASNESPRPLNIGFLSNITFEKGFVEFFKALDLLRARGLPYHAHMAGPVAPDARATFDRMLSDSTNVTYAGAIYGLAKQEFYRRLDVLLFPTKYVNEAEPLVIHEALREGVFTIACDRGAIAEILRNDAGLVLPEKAFVEGAAAWIADACAEPGKLGHVRRVCMQQARIIQSGAAVELDKLLQAMCTA